MSTQNEVGYMSLAFSQDAEREIQELVGRYPDRAAAMLPALYVAQREFGWLSDEALQLVATTLDLPTPKVLNTATFYTMFFKKPMGRHHIQVCKNIACYLRQSDDMMAVINDKLGLSPGQVSEDGEFSLEAAECLAACGTAPIVRINETYHENVTADGLRALLDELSPKDDPTPEGEGGDP